MSISGVLVGSRICDSLEVSPHVSLQAHFSGLRADRVEDHHGAAAEPGHLALVHSELGDHLFVQRAPGVQARSIRAAARGVIFAARYAG